MCGIAGIYSYKSNNLVDRNVLIKMRDTMVHRGPDGDGDWVSPDKCIALAHRRLSIIDMDVNASQPMCNEEDSIWLTFNGEIYNHKVLRQELQKCGHKFKTDHSDTEVLVHGYEEWGIKGLLDRIEGMYAFAIWDSKSKELFLARDRIGIKPVYFSLFKDSFIFASEIKALLKYPEIPRDISLRAMYHYLSFLTTPAPMTMFKGIFKLPAGHYLRLTDKGDFESIRYWDALPGNGIEKSELDGLSEKAKEDFYVRGVRERLENAVEKRMMSDVPFGAFLSGGIDSSANVALMDKHLDSPVNTFSVGFSDYTYLNELDYAESVAKKFKTNHHEILIDESDMVGYLDDLIHHQDEPIADWVCVPLYFVSKLAKDNGITVVQVGEGADEQFSGYASYMGYLRLYKRYWEPFNKYVPQVFQNIAAGAASFVSSAHPKMEIYADIIKRAATNREHFWSGATFFWDTMKDKLLNKELIPEEEIPEELKESGLIPDGYMKTDSFEIIKSFCGRIDEKSPGEDVLTRMIYNEFKLRLPELLLMRVDKISMANSLEARVPFLDHKLVEFTMDIPMRYKVQNGVPKYLLKKAVSGLIPDEIIHRKKMGFGAPMADWLKNDFGRTVEDRILSSKLLEKGYFCVGYIQDLFKDHRSGRRDNSGFIWVLFNLTSWYEYWVSS